MKMLPKRFADRAFFTREFQTYGNDLRVATVESRSLGGRYNIRVNGTTVGQVTSNKGEFDQGDRVLMNSYNERTNDYIAGPASEEDQSTKPPDGSNWDATDESSIL